ncbi:hypothetical protein M2437_005207 [Methylorubrum pseudosasae]|nr:hypothetical protein [Methylorubrum pseudosasae]
MLARSIAPVTAWRRGSSNRFISASTTLRTTSRAVSLVRPPSRPRMEIRVETRETSGWTASSISGSVSIRLRSSRSKASRCITCTTEAGK